jgi:RNA polymerase sigma-70 factor (ECF subfamily)
MIRGCIAGDMASQKKLYDLYVRKMMGICLWYAKNREEAEEILQDGFMRVFTYVSKFKGEGSLEGWIRKIMVNVALARYRSKTHLRPVILYVPEEHGLKETISPIDVLEAKELVSLVQMLPPGYRMVFNLYVLEGLKHCEIAKLLGISEGTSKSNLFDARRILRKQLEASHKKVASL